MRKTARISALMVAATMLGLGAPAGAIPYIPPPQPVYEAPIDRALANVEASEGIEPAQRERLLGRLNLLAYARDNGDFTYLRDGDQFNEPGSVACVDAPRNMRNGPDENATEFGPGDMCARLDFNLGPRDELPEAGNTNAASAEALGRLNAAEAHYARALELDGSDLRARLGHAYALDRLGRVRDARKELRRLIDLGLPHVAEARAEWEIHAVLSEAATHLEHLAQSWGERRRLARLRERLQLSQPMIYVTPVVAPLVDAPFDALIAPDSQVAFDFAGTGDVRAQGWLTPEAGWLVWDPQGRGQIRSGFDMLGERTWAVFWSDGFEALRSLDDNRDGELTGAELGGLALWRDSDGDGFSDAGEVRPLSAYGVASLGVRASGAQKGLLTAPRGVRLEDGRVRPLYDWTPGLYAPARVQAAPVS